MEVVQCARAEMFASWAFIQKFEECRRLYFGQVSR